MRHFFNISSFGFFLLNVCSVPPSFIFFKKTELLTLAHLCLFDRFGQRTSVQLRVHSKSSVSCHEALGSVANIARKLSFAEHARDLKALMVA